MVSVMVMRNEVNYFHHHALVVWFLLFGMLCIETISVSSASSELVSNKTMVNNNKCIATERRALLDIKRGLVHTHGNLSSWGSSKDEENCCQWRFVGCDHHTGHVTHLHLSSLNLLIDYSYSHSTSNISSSLLLLRNLKYLDLSRNVFYIPIPSFIGSLTNLVHLDLSGAGFQGAIPDELGNLSKLSYLALSYNNFEGPIPHQLGNLSKLHYLDLSDNHFEGPIPHQLGNLSKLHYLNLASRFRYVDHRNHYFDYLENIDSIDWLFHLSSLTYLDLSQIPIGNSSDWVSLIYKLPFLSVLRLTNCNLNSSRAPSSFTNSSAPISVLHLAGNLLDSSIFDWISNLSTSLVDLDLGDNQLQGNIPKSFSSMVALTILDLSYNQLEGIVPTDSLFHIVTLQVSGNKLTSAIFDWVSNMSTTLVNLDLSYNQLQGNIPKSFSSMVALRNLDLSYNQLEGIVPTDSLFHIVTLQLYENNFTSAIFDWVSNMSTTLVDLDLSDNLLQGQIPDTFCVGSLINLDLSHNLLQGQIPNSFGVMSGLAYLDLSYNQLEGMIPNSFHNLSSLQTVRFTSNKLTGNLQYLLNLLPEATLQTLLISGNQLTGSLPDITSFSFLEELNVGSNQLNGYLPKEFEHKSVLRNLSLSNNYLQGSLPNFTGFSFLRDLYLNDNKFSGSLPDFTGCSALEILQLGGNQLTDWETQSIGQLTNLNQLDLSRNLINSTINEHHLSKLYNLDQMNASFNSLTFNMSSEWLPPFDLDELSLASCKLGPKFPIWIRNQTEISTIDFSNTQIADIIPMWFWDNFTTITSLDLSSNKIRGTLSSIQLDTDVINLSSNYFEGPLPLISRMCSEINLSHNKFSGKLLSTSESMSLRFLDLSHNLLSGEVPDSWIYFKDLMFLNLGNNNFWGRIPMSIGYLPFLNKLILRNNTLHGELPESLRNCTNLGFVDFGLNGLSGTVPAWIGQDLPQLYALVLKSNKFYGSLPNDLCHLSHLHFLDLSMNRLSGNVPQCFSSLIAMINNGTRTTDHHNNRILLGNSYGRAIHRYGNPNVPHCSSPLCRKAGSQVVFSYLDDALAGWKGKEREFRRNFADLNMIDLSNNKFTGEFPVGITKLLDLKGLNLSRNMFYGKVPVQIGRLSQLEVLDLSSNKFSGVIPQSMSGLNFLAYLDLSSNNFSGRIPLGGQTFNSSMYEGNPGLCGLPLTKRCPGDETSVKVQPSSNANEVDEDEIVYKRWLYVSAALGFSTSFWGICASLLVNRRWRHAYFLFLMNLKDQLYVFMVVRIARLKVRLQG